MAGNLMRFDPFAELARFDRPFGGLEEMLEDFGMRPWQAARSAAPAMRMDVSEAQDAYMVKAEMPGMKKEDIKVAIDGNQVTISAESKSESEQKEGETLLRSERRYGRLYRSFSLPQDIDDAKAQARYEDGVLQLTLPKRAGNGAPKQLSIS
jgi:HSP20 family protein